MSIEKKSPEVAHHRRVRKGYYLGARAVEAEVFQGYSLTAQDNLLAKRDEMNQLFTDKLPLTPSKRRNERNRRTAEYQRLKEEIKPIASQARSMKESFEKIVEDEIDDLREITGTLLERDTGVLSARLYLELPPFLMSNYNNWKQNQSTNGSILDWLHEGADDDTCLNYLQWHHAHVDEMNGSVFEKNRMSLVKNAFAGGVTALVEDGSLAPEMMPNKELLDKTDLHYGDLLDYYSNECDGYAAEHQDGRPVSVLYVEPGGKITWHELLHTQYGGFNVTDAPAYQLLNEAFTELFAKMTSQRVPPLKSKEDADIYKAPIRIANYMFKHRIQGDEDMQRKVLFDISKFYSGKNPEENVEELRDYLQDINNGIDVVGILMSSISLGILNHELSKEEMLNADSIANRVERAFMFILLYTEHYLTDIGMRHEIDRWIDNPQLDKDKRMYLQEARSRALQAMKQTLKPEEWAELASYLQIPV